MNTKSPQLPVTREAIRDRDAVQTDIDRRVATRATLDTKIAEVESGLCTLDAHRAADDTERLVAGEEDLPDPSPDEVEARRVLERKRLALEAAKAVLDEQILGLRTKLRERRVALADAFLQECGGPERQHAASTFTDAIEGVVDQVARLAALDLVQEHLLGRHYEFSRPENDWALVSGKWLSEKVLELPRELLPKNLTADRLERTAQQFAAEMIAAIEKEK